MQAGERLQLTRIVRDWEGAVHRPGEEVVFIAPQMRLDDPMLMVRFANATRGYVFPHEVAEARQ